MQYARRLTEVVGGTASRRSARGKDPENAALGGDLAVLLGTVPRRVGRRILITRTDVAVTGTLKRALARIRGRVSRKEICVCEGIGTNSKKEETIGHLKF
jgi:hypothetical protein